jgi:hypothetical protein
MKSVINESKSAEQSKPFPKLMRGNITGCLALFESETKGIIVNVGLSKVYSIGQLIESGFYLFEDFEGSVTLFNE